MLFEVTHLTRYTYDRPVVLEPLVVRLRPRSDVFQRLIAFDLAIEPAPEGTSEVMDAQGNATTQAWFLGTASVLTLRSSLTVETLHANPYDYIVLDPAALRLPMPYEPAEGAALAQYLQPAGEPSVQAFADGVLAASGGGVTAFLGDLCKRIAAVINQEVRLAGDPMPPRKTLALGRGACRDLATLFIDACRCVGIAARFVTGYELGAAGSAERHLHAWAEVYLVGAGWRGYDPSQGLAVADRHVALAVGATPAQAAPTGGTFRGTGATSRLESVIRVRARTSAAAAPRPAAARMDRPPVAAPAGPVLS